MFAGGSGTGVGENERRFIGREGEALTVSLGGPDEVGGEWITGSSRKRKWKGGQGVHWGEGRGCVPGKVPEKKPLQPQKDAFPEWK